MNEYDLTIRAPQPQETRTTVLVTEPAREGQEANLIFSAPTYEDDEVARVIARSIEETARAQEVPIPPNDVSEPEAESEEGHFTVAMNTNLARREAFASRHRSAVNSETIRAFRNSPEHDRERQLQLLEMAGNTTLHRILLREHSLMHGLSRSRRLRRRAESNQLQAMRHERDLLLRERLQLIEHMDDSDEVDENPADPLSRDFRVQGLSNSSTSERAPTPETTLPVERQREFLVAFFQRCTPSEITRYWSDLVSTFQQSAGIADREAFESFMNDLNAELD